MPPLMPENRVIQSAAKGVTVSVPVKVRHRVDVFENGNERHSIWHPTAGIFVGDTFDEAFCKMKSDLHP